MDPSGWGWWNWCYSKTEFNLTVPPTFSAGDKLYILADPPKATDDDDDRRGNVRGMIRLVEEEEDSPPPEDLHAQVKVEVRARYSRNAERYFRGVNVVKLGRSAFDQGIGIYVSCHL